MNVYEIFTRTVAAACTITDIHGEPVAVAFTDVTPSEPRPSVIGATVGIAPTDADGTPRKFRRSGREYVGPYTGEIRAESTGRVYVWTDDDFPELEIFPARDTPERIAVEIGTYVHAVYDATTGRFRWKSAEIWARDPAYIAAGHVVRYDPETGTVRPRPA